MKRWASLYPQWAFAYEDETWWSRVKQPALHAWAGGQPLRLVQQAVSPDDPDPQALACYGLLVSYPGERQPAGEHVWLRFVDGRPVSVVTTEFLAWCCTRLEAAGKTALFLVWDNASWHISRWVRDWIHSHNRQVKQQGQGVRLIVNALPVRSPWLNPLEPRWVHGKRRVAEPARLLTAQELADRVCAHFNCVHEAHLAVPEMVV